MNATRRLWVIEAKVEGKWLPLTKRAYYTRREAQAGAKRERRFEYPTSFRVRCYVPKDPR